MGRLHLQGDRATEEGSVTEVIMLIFLLLIGVAVVGYGWLFYVLAMSSGGDL